jgi:hypothetical protein
MERVHFVDGRVTDIEDLQPVHRDYESQQLKQCLCGRNGNAAA